jgi:hypothetical protein
LDSQECPLFSMALREKASTLEPTWIAGKRVDVVDSKEAINMTDNLVANALKHRRDERLSSIEVQQLSDLRKAYGTHNVLQAIRFAKTTQIRDVGRMLLQQCGFRSNLGASLQNVIPDKASAKRTFSPEKYAAGCRLEEATRSVDPEIERHTRSLLSLWKSKFSPNYHPSALVENAIRSAVRSFGMPFARAGIQIVLNTTSYPEHQLIANYKEWLELASTQSNIRLGELLGKLGIDSRTQKFEIPPPLPMRLEKYFVAKANRQPTQAEKAVLWSRLRRHKTDDIIHAMSCTPSCEFTLEKVEKILVRNEPFGVELVASIRNKPATAPLSEEEEETEAWATEDDVIDEQAGPP